METSTRNSVNMAQRRPDRTDLALDADTENIAQDYIEPGLSRRLNVQCFHTSDAFAQRCANDIAGSSDIEDDRFHQPNTGDDLPHPKAFPLTRMSINNLKRNVNFLILADTNELFECYRFLRNLQQSGERFKEKSAYFAMVLVNQPHGNPYARRIQSILTSLGAVQFINGIRLSVGGTDRDQIDDLIRWSISVLRHPDFKIPSSELLGSHQLFVESTAKREAYVTLEGVAPIISGNSRAVVYKGLKLHHNGEQFVLPPADAVQKVAIKVANIAMAHGNLESPWREILSRRMLEHEEFVPKRFCDLGDQRHVYMTSEWLDDGSLEEYRNKYPDRCSQEQLAKDFTRQIVNIFKTLHGKYNLCHSDVKCGNFLVRTFPEGSAKHKDFPNGQVLLSDFAQTYHMPSEGKMPAIRPSGGWRGTQSWMLGKQYKGQAYNARLADLSGGMLSVFCIRTGLSHPYHTPCSKKCYLYAYFIEAGGLLGQNDETDKVKGKLMQSFQDACNGLELAAVDSVDYRKFDLQVQILANTTRTIYEVEPQLPYFPGGFKEMIKAVIYEEIYNEDQLLQMPWIAAMQ